MCLTSLYSFSQNSNIRDTLFLASTHISNTGDIRIVNIETDLIRLENRSIDSIIESSISSCEQFKEKQILSCYKLKISPMKEKDNYLVTVTLYSNVPQVDTNNFIGIYTKNGVRFLCFGREFSYLLFDKSFKKPVVMSYQTSSNELELIDEKVIVSNIYRSNGVTFKLFIENCIDNNMIPKKKCRKRKR